MHSEFKDKSIAAEEPAKSRVCPTCQLSVSSTVSKCPNDGTSLLGQDELQGHLASQYEFISLIASGGMGIVYEARHLALNQRVAIKMIQTEHLDEAHIKRFKREAELLSSLDHKNIVKVRDYGMTDHGQPYMVLDYIGGISLAQLLAKSGLLSVDEAIEIFVQISDALAHAHERGILHRDLKPGNIMISPEPDLSLQAKIIDFGIGRVLNENAEKGLTQTGEVLGSPAYMSPEQITGALVNQQTDIYSLGCVLFEALTGATPFKGATAIDIIFQQMNSAPPKLSDVTMSNFPQSLEQIVSQCLQKDPDKRFHSMHELRDQLAGVDTKVTQSSVPNLSQNKKVRTFASLMLCLCFVFLLITIFSIVYLVVLKNKERAELTQHIAKSEQLKKAQIAKDAQEVMSYDENKMARALIMEHKHSADPKRRETLYMQELCTDDALDALANGPATFTSVYVEKSFVKGPGLAYLIRYPLKMLSLNDSSVTDRAFLEIARMPLLKELQMDGTDITGKGLAGLIGSKLSRLSVLEDKLNYEGMKNICQIRTLEHLQCGRNPDLTANEYVLLKNSPNLIRLDVLTNPIDVKTAKIFSELPKLEELYVSETDLSDDGLKQITNAPKLFDLDIGRCDNITAKGLPYLAKLKKILLLDVEGLSWLKDEDLSFLKKFPMLNNLDVRNTSVTEKLLDYIATENIETLKIYCNLDEETVLRLAKMKALKTLYVNLNSSNQAAVDGLKKLRPDIDVRFDLRTKHRPSTLR